MSIALALESVPMLVGGRWQRVEASRYGDVFNPSTGRAIARVPFANADDVDRAVRAASEALPAWADTPAVERKPRSSSGSASGWRRPRRNWPGSSPASTARRCPRRGRR